MTQAQKQEIQNWSSFTNTYFDLRATNRRVGLRSGHEKLTEAQLNRIAQERRPNRLRPSKWTPSPARSSGPTCSRTTSSSPRPDVATAFEERANLGTMPWKYVKEVQQATQTMLDELSDMVRDIAPADYLPAKRFIQSLAYEARKPLS